MTREDTTERLDGDVAEAIGSLGDRRRLEILFALAEAERASGTMWKTLSFTELYDAVDLDSTSQFSYHLKRLVGPFLTETADGYHLTYGGAKIARAIRSGEYESTSEFEERAVDGVCVFCESSSLVATLADEQFHVRCRACDSTLVTDFFPRSQSRGRTPAEIVESFGHRIWSSFVQLRGNVCPECYGRVETCVEALDPDDAARVRGEATRYSHVSACRECGFVITFPVEVAAAFHPAALGHFWEHGVSLWGVPIWEFFAFIVSDAIATDVVSTEPVEIRFDITLDGQTLRLEMDETMAISVP